jgi:uncharacterized membrane protein YkvA (DUF1232 family)
MPDYHKKYSNRGFWNKVKSAAATAGKEVLVKALTLYYCAADDDTPTAAKATAYSALGYFILPIDVIPDIMPALGYSDDLSIIVAAITALASHIKPEHKKQARTTVKEWFD